MIHCQKCKHQNVTEASACEQCGANLLPSEGLASRIIKALILVSFGTAIIVMGFNWLEIDVYIYSIAALGLLLILIGIVAMVRKTPLYQRYETRANRHFKRDPQQALSDLNTAIALAPKRIPFSVTNLGKILGTALGRAYNSLRGGQARSSLRLKDTVLSRSKVRLVSRKLKFLLKQDKERALQEMITEIRMTEQTERGDSLRKALPNRLITMGLKLGEQVKKDKVVGNVQDVQSHWLQYSYVAEANIKKLTGSNTIVMGWEDGAKEGLRSASAERDIQQQLGIERIGIWRKKELIVIAYCYTCHAVVETGFNFDLNPKADCHEAMLQSISNCPVSADHDIGWPIFVAPQEAEDMKQALQHRMGQI